jgi:hypothetical protein
MMEVTVPACATTDPFLWPAREFEPAYLALYQSGDLQRRARQAIEQLAACRLCPRNCGVDRLADRTAACKTGQKKAPYAARSGSKRNHQSNVKSRNNALLMTKKKSKR